MGIEGFWQQVEALADEFNIGHHPFVRAVNEGRATRQQLRQFAVEHYEMTVRDSGPYIAQGYCSMAKLDGAGAKLMAENFAEEAMGLHTGTARHAALLFEFWERGLGLPREALENSSASTAARGLNAYFWLMMTQKIRYSAAAGILEGGFSKACEKMLFGLQHHYGIKADALRFFSGHVEADREHAATGRKLIERLLTNDLERIEFLTEVRCFGELYWRGWDAMVR